jgi:hypothetical protein
MEKVLLYCYILCLYSTYWSNIIYVICTKLIDPINCHSLFAHKAITIASFNPISFFMFVINPIHSSNDTLLNKIISTWKSFIFHFLESEDNFLKKQHSKKENKTKSQGFCYLYSSQNQILWESYPMKKWDTKFPLNNNST